MKSAILIRGIYLIVPEDKEFKETIKNARKKLETSVAPAMPCKIMKKNCGSGASNKIITRLACILEADESKRLRMGNSMPQNHHEDHIAGKGENSLQHYNLVHKFIPLTQGKRPTLANPVLAILIWLIHFWPSWFWPGQFWPKPILANPLWESGLCVMVGRGGGVRPQTQKIVVHRRVGARRFGARGVEVQT